MDQGRRSEKILETYEWQTVKDGSVNREKQK